MSDEPGAPPFEEDDDDDFAAFLSAALDPGEIELGERRHAELRAAMGIPHEIQADPELEAFAAFLSTALDPGDLELDETARKAITGAAESLRPGDLVSWALGELPLSRRRAVEEILSARPDLRDEALSLRHFCTRLRERLPAAASPGLRERLRLRWIFRESSSMTTRRFAQVAVAAVVALLLVPVSLYRQAPIREQAVRDAASRHESQTEELSAAEATGHAPPQMATVETEHEPGPEQSVEAAMAPPVLEQAAAVAERTQVPEMTPFPIHPAGQRHTPLHVAEVAYVPALSSYETSGAAIPVSLVVPKTPEGRSPHLMQLADTSGDRQQRGNSNSETLIAGTSSAQAEGGITMAREFNGAMPIATFTRTLSFDAVGSAFQVNLGASEPAPGDSEGGETVSGNAKTTLVSAFHNGTSVLTNLQPYLLTALVSSTGGNHGLVALEDGLVWDANAGFRTLDFDSFALNGGMRAETWTGTASVAKALTASLTLGANLSAIDSRGKIDRYGRIDVTGSVAGWSLDWQHGAWELGLSNSFAKLDQDLTRTSGGIGRSSQDATLQQLDLHAAWKKDLGVFRHGPLLNLQSSWGQLDSYQEPGANGVAVAGRNFNSLDSLAGWEIDGSFDTAAGDWKPHLLAGWRHRLRVPDGVVRQSSFGSTSLFQPDAPERDSLLLEAALQWSQKNGPLYAEGAVGMDWRGAESDRSLMLRVGARF